MIGESDVAAVRFSAQGQITFADGVAPSNGRYAFGPAVPSEWAVCLGRRSRLVIMAFGGASRPVAPPPARANSMIAVGGGSVGETGTIGWWPGRFMIVCNA